MNTILRSALSSTAERSSAPPYAPERNSISWTPVVAVFATVVWIASAIYMWHFGKSWHLDLRVYRAAGRSLLDHGTPFRSFFTTNHLPFTYSPFALLALTPLSFGPLGLVEGAWWLASSAALVAALYVLIPNSTRIGTSRARRLAIASLMGGAATLVLEPVRSNMDYGQINLLLMWLVVADLRQPRPKFRGLAIGLAAAVKLTPIVYLLFFAVRRDWRSVIQGAVAFSTLSLVAWLILPADSALYWFHEVTDVARVGSIASTSNQSLNGMLHRLHFLGRATNAAVWVALCFTVVVLGGLIVRRLASNQRPLVESVLVLALVELLISPISWTHHWSWLALAPLTTLSLWRNHRRTSVLVGATTAIGVVAPYWWGIQRGFGGFLADNSLVLAGIVTLFAWANSLFAAVPWALRSQDPGTAGSRTDCLELDRRLLVGFGREEPVTVVGEDDPRVSSASSCKCRNKERFAPRPVRSFAATSTSNRPADAVGTMD